MNANENTETQAMDMMALFQAEGYPVPGTAEAESEPMWSRWVHYYPSLVDTMSAQAGVPEEEVIEHLGHITNDVHAERVAATHTDGEVLRRYLEQFVAVG